MTQPPDNDVRSLCSIPAHATIEGGCQRCDRIIAALNAVAAAERDRWTREVQYRFDTCEARHVDEWRAFAVKMGVVLDE